MAQQQMVKEERSLGDLFAELASDTGTLVRQEVALAQTEITQTASKAGRNIVSLAVGGAVGYVAVLAFTAGIILLVGQFIPLWLSALIVGAVVGVMAYFMITAAIKKLQDMDLVPRATVETLKEDAEWIKNEIS